MGKEQEILDDSIKEFHLTVPVVLITYKRLDTTKIVFEQIRKARPEKLYLISDGPKEGAQQDAAKIAAVRDYLDKAVDWDCQVVRDYSEYNQGCKTRIVTGIDHVFENEECAIIIEDDVSIHDTFFEFCQIMSEYYKDDERIGMVQCLNMCPDYINKDNRQYYFSRYAATWGGWLTWKRVWKTYSVSTPDYEEICSDKRLEKYWDKWYGGEVSRGLQRVEEGRVQAWDYQFWYTLARNNQLVIVPAQNLAGNIGFDMEDATHTTGKCIWKFPPGEITFPIARRNDYAIEEDFDRLYSDTYYKKNIIQVIYGFVMSHVLDFLKYCGIIKSNE